MNQTPGRIVSTLRVKRNGALSARLLENAKAVGNEVVNEREQLYFLDAGEV